MKNFTQIPNTLIRNPKFNVYEKNILIILISLNPCHPSHTQLAEWTNLNKRTVIRTLKRLRDKNVITWRPGFKNRCNLYQVKPESMWKLDLATESNGDSHDPKE